MFVGRDEFHSRRCGSSHGKAVAARFAASASISSIFCSVIDLRGIILGLHNTCSQVQLTTAAVHAHSLEITSLKLPFSEYTSPALGSTSCHASKSLSYRSPSMQVPLDAGTQKIEINHTESTAHSSVTSDEQPGGIRRAHLHF